MTRAQECICRYIHKNFQVQSVELTPIEDDKIMVKDRNNESVILTINIFGDIMDAVTKTVYAISDLPHQLDKLADRLPTNWVEVDRK